MLQFEVVILLGKTHNHTPMLESWQPSSWPLVAFSSILPVFFPFGPKFLNYSILTLTTCSMVLVFLLIIPL